ncbi:Rha family transcriptional regulator [Aneurinibacillus migulanus]|uniref:Rha family transcriptional regulator n=1 Tax=Aneurinibacillus migulanus TaxID=47500 RepID=UPI00209EAE39|nr:Rha family transcriptional regulator [Aneurinibacillus migulanus]MCP1355056.1 Rha family transcriptional regulator [Aneurinibacillus migulanus]
MNQLKVINNNGQLLIDSRDIAEMISVRHSDLLERIDGYISVLNQNGEFRSDKFFIESSYRAGTGKRYKHYYLTRKGCDMVAHKVTGEKGVLFTAAYVTKFEEMEKTIQAGFNVSQLSPQLQLLIQMEQGMKQLEERQQSTEKSITVIQETFLQRDSNWRKSINSMLNQAASRLGGEYRELRNESYQKLEERGRCNLNIRLTNLKERLSENGATKTKINQTTKMDVIESDARLKEIYTTIVKELSIGSLSK